jgi:hypothetical protein
MIFVRRGSRCTSFDLVAIRFGLLPLLALAAAMAPVVWHFTN